MVNWQVFNSPLKLIRTLSLDIVCGAVAISFFLSSVFDLTLPILYWVALGFTVWLIYLVDHFADSYLPGSYSNKTELHRLRAYRKLLGRLSMLSILVLITITFLLPIRIIIFGIAGVMVMITYTILNQVQNYSVKVFFSRELIIAFFYTLGTAAVPLMYLKGIVPPQLIIVGGVFFLVLTNTLICSSISHEHDVKSGVKTMAVVFNPLITQFMGISTGILSCGIFAYLSQIPDYYIHGIIGILMAVTLILIHLLIKIFSKNFLAVMADIILLLPFIILFL